MPTTRILFASIVAAVALSGTPAIAATPAVVATHPASLTTQGIIMRDGGICDPIRHMGC